MIDLEYIEIDGLLYPNIDTGSKRLRALDKYGKIRLEYLHAQKPDLYREMLFAGKMSEQIQDSYIAKHPLPNDDFWMRVSIRTMAQMVAVEVVQFQVIEG